MIKKNYKSDFEFLLRIKSFGPDTVEIDGDNTRVLFPNYDFTGVLSTSGRPGQTYSFSRVGDRFVNCSRDGDLLHVVLNNHGLDPGQMTLEWNARIPNTSFLDGYEDIAPKFKLPIELVRCAGDCECTPAEIIDVLMPYAMITAYETAVSLGYTGTREEYEAALADMPQATLAAREAGRMADAATDRATTAASGAEAAINAANTAANAANSAANAANGAARTANTAADAANTAASRATNAASGVEAATEAANTAAASANQATANVTAAINTAQTAANTANAAADRADATTNLFSDYAEGKRKIAKAITQQGVTTSEDDTMTQMAENIKQLYLPCEADFWKALGYETEADFSGGLGMMIENIKALIDLWDTGQFTNAVSSWISAYTIGGNKLVICPKVDTSAVTNMGSMFYNCTSLQSIPQLDTSAVTNMGSMFQNCTSLQSIPQLDTSAVTNMGIMFYNCTSLQSIPQLDTSAVTNMGSMFYNCTSLQSIPQLDTSAVANMGSMFQNCTSLRECKLLGLKVGLTISVSSELENDSILYIIENSAATKNITITLHAEAYNRAVADASIQAALEAHPLVSLAKA